ncbi:MAG: hypothetical protein EHM61_01055 [Acidobacteria bacterium]|nr:MAG: hypothetical protein EHM61_01055 [Acidobacteriota bacterium]
MRLSSIFSFDTYRAIRGSLLWLALLLALLVAGELLLRAPIVVSALPRPEPTLWHAPLIQTKLDYLRKFEKDHGIDVLFIGNSAVQAGVNPTVFDSERRRLESAKPDSFNAAIEGLPPYGVRLFLEIYLRHSSPRVIIYGITPQDINSASPWARDVTQRVQQSILALAESERGLLGWTYARLLRLSHLYRYRYVLHQLLLRGGAMRGDGFVYFDERGFHPIRKRLSQLDRAERVRLRNRAGVLNYSTEGEQLDELKKLMGLCSEKGIRLILVNMPLADDYYGNFDNPADYKTYLDTISDIAHAYGVPFWDMEHLPSEQNLTDEDFADLNHLNRSGAAKLSRLVGRRCCPSSEAQLAGRFRKQAVGD